MFGAGLRADRKAAGLSASWAGRPCYGHCQKTADLAWIRAYGWQALETGRLDGALCDFGAVFNTVPSPVLGHLLLAQLPKGCLCVELAPSRAST